MKIGIIGAGFTGLSAAFYLAKEGYDVTVFESDKQPGGLASGVKRRKWSWAVEEHYHHWFSNDLAILKFASELKYKVLRRRIKTSILYKNKIYKLDSPVDLLVFDRISIFDRLRTSIVLAYLKITPLWRPLERITAQKFLLKYMGRKPWRVFWEPLFRKKFDNFFEQVPASWFWARIKKRTLFICYPRGGFQKFANAITREVVKLGGHIFYRAKVVEVSRSHRHFTVTTMAGKYLFDKLIFTLPYDILYALNSKIAKDAIPSEARRLPHLGAVNLLVALKNKFFEDGTYWLNVNDSKYPFLVVIEHTNFVDKRNYGNNNLVYVGNYLPPGHEYFSKTAKELVDIFVPYLRKAKPGFKKTEIVWSQVFKTEFAQSVTTLNYSKRIVPIKTSVKGFYIANMQQVYPWDRGTNYAVALGKEVANIVKND
jgi:protoporphyrinogen oxidase